MALAHSPKIATDGLVFYYDMANTQKSWLGKPTTNFYTNGHFSNGTGIAQESGSNATNTVIFFPYNPGNSQYVLEQSGGPYTEYQINLSSQLLPSTTYVLSGWYAESIDYVGESRMFHCRAFSSSGAHVALGVGIGTVIETRVVNGITWKYCYDTITTPSDYSNDFNWYLGYGGGSYTGKRYYTNVQMEQGSYPNRFVNGTRSNTQAITDLVGNNTVTATSLTYASNNTFSFDGSNYASVNAITGISDFTVEIWFKSENVANYRNPIDCNWLRYPGAYSNVGPRLEQNSSGNLAWIFGDISGNYEFRTVVSSGLTSSVYHCACLTKNGNIFTSFYNGIVVQSGAATYTWPGNFNSINIGRGFTEAGERLFIGQIPSIKTYNRALSATEVQQNFNAQRGRYGL